MPQNLTDDWGDKLAQLVAQEVVNPPPAENAVNARIAGINDTGIAALVSKLKKDAATYDGFALVFHHDTDYKDFQWLQFITRQLVVDNTAITGNLLFSANTTSYQLVDSPAEITDYTFVSGPKPANWNSCWKVDSTLLPNPKPFFRDGYEYAFSDVKKLTAILDAPSPMGGRNPPESDESLYQDFPGGLVVMKEKLGSHDGIARAYFSDYLVKKEKKDGVDKWRIVARFDFNETWNPVTKDTPKKNFILHSVKTTATSELLECHKEALKHTTSKGKTPWKDFEDLILP
jgi:hypothetical protein